MSNIDSENCVASWCADDEWCSVTCTAHLLGNKWYPVIVHCLLERGSLGFNVLKAEIEGISSTVLSNSLENLENDGLVDRAIVSEKPFRVEYLLTEQGTSLSPIIEAMDEWGTSYLSDTECRA